MGDKQFSEKLPKIILGITLFLFVFTTDTLPIMERIKFLLIENLLLVLIIIIIAFFALSQKK